MELSKTHISVLKYLRTHCGVEDLSLDPAKTFEVMDAHYKFPSTKVVITALRKVYPENKVFIAEMKKRGPIWKGEEVTQTATEEQIEKFVPWDKIIEFRDSYYEEMSPLHRLLLALYTYIPPVRLDFTPMRIVARRPKKLEDGMNYYVRAKAPYFMMHAFKTHAHMGDQKIKVPAKLKEEIDKWITPDQTYLFQNKEGKPWLENTLGAAVRRIFEQYHGIHTGVGMIRHAYATKFHKGQLPLSEITKTASAMLHGPLQSMTYRFIALE